MDQKIEPAAFTIDEWCVRRKYSPATYYKMRKAGYGPRETRIPHSTKVTVTLEADREWEARMAKINTELAGQLEAERAAHVKRASKAGKAAVASPKHFSNLTSEKRQAKIDAKRARKARAA